MTSFVVRDEEEVVGSSMLGEAVSVLFVVVAFVSQGRGGPAGVC